MSSPDTSASNQGKHDDHEAPTSRPRGRLDTWTIRQDRAVQRRIRRGGEMPSGKRRGPGQPTGGGSRGGARDAPDLPLQPAGSLNEVNGAALERARHVSDVSPNPAANLPPRGGRSALIRRPPQPEDRDEERREEHLDPGDDRVARDDGEVLVRQVAPADRDPVDDDRPPSTRPTRTQTPRTSPCSTRAAPRADRTAGPARP